MGSAEPASMRRASIDSSSTAMESAESAFMRRASIDSFSSAKELLESGVVVDRLSSMPRFLQQFLQWTGGKTGAEHILIKASCVLLSFVFALAPASASWYYGMHIEEATVLYVAMFVLVLGSYIMRWHILKSGLLWSLMDPETHKNSLHQFEVEVRALWMTLPVEGVVLSALCVGLGILVDVAGRVAVYGDLCRNLGIVCFSPNVFLHCFVAGTVKFSPLALRAICSTLAEDLQRFHHAVEDIVLATDWDSPDSCAKLLNNLQHLELHLRTRFTLANKTLEPLLGFTLSCLTSVTLLALILLVRTHRQGQHFLAVGLWGAIGLQYAFLLISVLRSAARVGDSWQQIVDAFNTPMMCSRTASVLSGVPIAQRLAELRYMGVVLNGHAVTSSAVSSLLFTLTSGLFLALWTLLTG
eukprot:TRINITY_DN110194_c0_g1_i1.p1 TRINITY_DN110194_c0_g1~~TRINITY_DN110194_c0_g1_i1.p1  ORF type:complete len:459 (-),score=49.98 TRINITY_DN110194_c0_g1_i1:101-1339(-)